MWTTFGAKPAKVFCFFFSKKKRLLASYPASDAAMFTPSAITAVLNR